MGHFRKKRETGQSELFTKTSGSFTQDRLKKKKMAKLKLQRRRRQWGRQKSSCFKLAKQQLFCTFLCRICTTTTWNCLILLFREEVNKRRRTYSLSKLKYGFYKFNSRRFRLKWVRIILIKTERTQIHFWSDDFAAVASSDREVRKQLRERFRLQFPSWF